MWGEREVHLWARQRAHPVRRGVERTILCGLAVRVASGFGLAADVGQRRAGVSVGRHVSVAGALPPNKPAPQRLMLHSPWIVSVQFRALASNMRFRSPAVRAVRAAGARNEVRRCLGVVGQTPTLRAMSP